MTTLTTNERAAAIRKALRAKLGAGPREVSVRCDKYSMGASIYVMVKTNAIKLADVEAIANEHESISYCAHSGEILSGGNTYMHVEYSEEALAPLVELIKRELATVTASNGVEFRGVNMWTEGEYHCGLAVGSINIRCWGANSFAHQLAVELLNGKAQGWGAATVWGEPAAEPVNSQVAFLEAVGAL